jgi:hypothetical protein
MKVLVPALPNIEDYDSYFVYLYLLARFPDGVVKKEWEDQHEELFKSTNLSKYSRVDELKGNRYLVSWKRLDGLYRGMPGLRTDIEIEPTMKSIRATMRRLYLSALVLHKNGLKGQTLEYIAQETGIPRSTVAHALRHLERKRRVVHAKEYPADHPRKYNVRRDRLGFSILMENCYVTPSDFRILSYSSSTGSNTKVGGFENQSKYRKLGRIA